MDQDELRADEKWSSIANKYPKMSEMANVMKRSLTIPHSSAAERIFSMVRKTSTDQRAFMLPKMTEALLVLKGKPGSYLDNERELCLEELLI